MLKDIMQPFIMHLNGRSYSIMCILLNRVQKIYFMDGGKNFCCPCMLMKCTTECFGPVMHHKRFKRMSHRISVTPTYTQTLRLTFV